MSASIKRYHHFSSSMAGTHIATSLSSGQAASVIAASIPQELFSNIVRHVIKVDVDGWLPHVSLRGQLNCALVCVYWAQEIRQSLYDKRAVWLVTEEQAKGFRKLLVHRGSKRLTPILDMIADINIRQNAHSRAWHHILLCLIPFIPPYKLRRLHIYGQRSVGPPSPHWGVPKRLPSFTTPYRRLWLSNLRFASLHALVTLLRQFPCLEELDLLYLRWDDNDIHAQAHPLPLITPQRRQPLLSRITMSECGDDALLFLHLAQLRPHGHSLLKTLSDEDQGAVSEIINVVWLAGVQDVWRIDFTVTSLSG